MQLKILFTKSEICEDRVNYFKVLFFMVIMNSLAFAQQETVFSGEIKSGGFGAPVIKFTSLDGNFGVLVGGRGGWIINNNFAIGGGGYGLVNNIHYKSVLANNEYIDFGYGGLEMEYFFSPERLIHLSLYSLIGGGGLSERRNNSFDNSDWEWSNNKGVAFFIFEPGANATLNLTSIFRISLGATYRIISGPDYNGLKPSKLDGFSGVLQFKFGTFIK
jgi:hypothetical protein